MTTSEKIKAVAEATFPTWTHIVGDWYDTDKAVNRKALPAIVRILPSGGSVAVRNGKKYDSENNLIAFVDKVARDADGEDNIEAYNRMKEAAETFVAALNASGYFDSVTSWSYQTIYEQLSDIVTGVVLQITLTEGRC